MLAAVALVTASTVGAQATGVVSGVVTDATDVPLIGAVVTVAGTAITTTTDELGRFRIAGAPIGSAEIQVRRLGFAQSIQKTQVTPRESAQLRFRLSANPSTLEPVVVQAARVSYEGRLAGYYERLQRKGSGHFITREQIDKNKHRSLSKLIADVPGISSLNLRNGGGAVRMRGRTCRPIVWIDGVPMSAGEVDLDAFPAYTLHGIEVYLGSATAPLSYSGAQGQSGCGAILLWSRGRDTEFELRQKRARVDLEQMIASLTVYTPEMVDTPAQLAKPASIAVTYPAPLFAQGTIGAVVAEFIVDSSGKIEASSVGIVSSTHPLFSGAVLEALEGLIYSPALKNGKPVRQVIQQSFAFKPTSNRPAKGGG